MKFRAPKWQGDFDQFAAGLLAWLEAAGASNYDESVSQYAHALQSAALAKECGGCAALVVAALLHDVGHLLIGEDDGGKPFLERDLEHERVGSLWLSRAFGADVTGPIRMHVAAKRYLCSIDAAYYGGLSDASKRSLDLQGGTMTVDEIREFIAQPAAQDAIELRRIDDLAKEPGRIVPGGDEYRPLLVEALRNASAARSDS